jgi:hypothetical protein
MTKGSVRNAGVPADVRTDMLHTSPRLHYYINNVCKKPSLEEIKDGQYNVLKAFTFYIV